MTIELCNPNGSSCLQSVLLNITEDRILEENEKFGIVMSSDFQQVVIENTNATVTILDDDSEY